jgi:MFS family permease
VVRAEHRQIAFGVGLSLAILAAASLASIAYSANAPLIRATFDLTEVEVGAIASCIYLGATASSITSGRLTDSLGVGPVLAMSMLALSIGLVVSALAPVAAIFFAGLVIAGLGYGAVNPPTNVLANPANPRRRALSMSIKQSGVPLGGILAGFIVPVVAAVTDWRWSLLIPIVACAGLALFSAQLGPMSPASAEDAGANGPRTGLRLAHAYTYGFLVAGVQVAVFIFLAVYLVDERGFDPGRAGASLAILLIGGLIGRPGWGWISDRLHDDRVRVLQVAAVLSATFLALLPLADGPWLVPVMIGVGLCSVGWNGVFLALLTEIVPANLIGSTTGVAMLLVHLGAVLLPPIIGLVAAMTGGWLLAWLLCAAATMVAVVVLHVGRTPHIISVVEGRPHVA